MWTKLKTENESQINLLNLEKHSNPNPMKTESNLNAVKTVFLSYKQTVECEDQASNQTLSNNPVCDVTTK